MNEKINGLWDKAVTLVEQEPDGDWSLDATTAKFAELIIRECARDFDNTYMSGGKTMGDYIRQKFGVEE
jgi:hypothetical protein